MSPDLSYHFESLYNRVSSLKTKRSRKPVGAAWSVSQQKGRCDGDRAGGGGAGAVSGLQAGRPQPCPRSALGPILPGTGQWDRGREGSPAGQVPARGTEARKRGLGRPSRPQRPLKWPAPRPAGPSGCGGGGKARGAAGRRGSEPPAAGLSSTPARPQAAARSVRWPRSATHRGPPGRPALLPSTERLFLQAARPHWRAAGSRCRQ